MHLGGEAVGHVAGRGKPAGRIKQIADGLLDGREFQSFDRPVLVAGDGAVVNEGPMVGLAGNERRGGSDADGSVGGALTIEQLAAFIGDFGDLERGMKAEIDDVEIGGRGKADTLPWPLDGAPWYPIRRQSRSR